MRQSASSRNRDRPLSANHVLASASWSRGTALSYSSRAVRSPSVTSRRISCTMRGSPRSSGAVTPVPLQVRFILKPQQLHSQDVLAGSPGSAVLIPPGTGAAVRSVSLPNFVDVGANAAWHCPVGVLPCHGSAGHDAACSRKPWVVLDGSFRIQRQFPVEVRPFEQVESHFAGCPQIGQSLINSVCSESRLGVQYPSR